MTVEEVDRRCARAVATLEATIAALAVVVDQLVVDNQAIRERIVEQEFRDTDLAKTLPWGEA